MQLLPILLLACCVFVMSLVDVLYLYHACEAQLSSTFVCFQSVVRMNECYQMRYAYGIPVSALMSERVINESDCGCMHQ
jgi:hypothetical protein